MDEKTMNALAKLYDDPDGIPFEELGLDNQVYRVLLDEKLVEEPEGALINTGGGDWFFAHGGLVFLTGAGKLLVEQHRQHRLLMEQLAKNQAQKEAQEKREKKRDRLFQLSLVLVGSALTLFAEQIPKILRWLQSLIAS